jgi:hypothetical protein
MAACYSAHCGNASGVANSPAPLRVAMPQETNMPTNQPNNAPGQLANDAADESTAARVIADEQLDDASAGGGLGGLAAAEGAPAATRPNDAETRSAPLTPQHAADAPGQVEDEAKRRAVAPDATDEAHLRSL